MPNNTAESYAKMAEPVELAFCLWSQVDLRKDALNEGAHWRHLTNTI